MSDGSILHRVLELAKDESSRVNLEEVPWQGAEGGNMTSVLFNGHPKDDDGGYTGASASEEVGAKILGKRAGYDHGKGVTNSSKIISILVNECGLIRHPNNTHEYDILAFGHPKLTMGGVAKNVSSLHEDGKYTSTKKKSDGASKEAASGGKKDELELEEDGKPSAKENESSGGKKRKGTGGGEKKKKKDPNAPKNPRSGKDL